MRFVYKVYRVGEGLIDLETDHEGRVAFETDCDGYLLELPITNPPKFRAVAERSKYAVVPQSPPSDNVLYLGMQIQYALQSLNNQHPDTYEVRVTEIVSDEQSKFVVFFAVPGKE